VVKPSTGNSYQLQLMKLFTRASEIHSPVNSESLSSCPACPGFFVRFVYFARLQTLNSSHLHHPLPVHHHLCQTDITDRVNPMIKLINRLIDCLFFRTKSVKYNVFRKVRPWPQAISWLKLRNTFA
jgi:hypothetical protein